MRFWKMHGLGNDYIVIDNRDQKISDEKAADWRRSFVKDVSQLAQMGFFLFVHSKVADVKMRIFNADGSEAEMCGNGIRCFSKYCYENGIAKKLSFQLKPYQALKHVWLTLKGNEVHFCQS